VQLILKKQYLLVLKLLKLEELILLLISSVLEIYLLIRNTAGLASVLKLRKEVGISLDAD
jgi:hypothetical protein